MIVPTCAASKQCGICASIGFVRSCTINVIPCAFAQQADRIAPVCVLHVFNATPVPRDDYWVGVPDAGRYAVIFDSDYPAFGGSGFAGASGYDAFGHTVHGFPHAIRMRLPPLAAVFLRRAG